MLSIELLYFIVMVGVFAVSCFKFKTNGNDLDASENQIVFGSPGVSFTNLTAKLGSADDRLYVFVE